LTKTFGIGADGSPVSTKSAGIPARGTAERVPLTGSPGDIMRQLAAVLDLLGQDQALILAPPPDGRDKWVIVRSRDIVPGTSAIAKTAANFKSRPGASIFGLDFDMKAWPRDLQTKVADFPGGLAGVLASVFPAFGRAACLSRPSVSTGIANIETGASTGHLSGLHTYYLARSGADVGSFATRLRQRLLLAGWGYGFITAAGTILVRTLIDEIATEDASRLWYEADPVLDDKRLRRETRCRDPRAANPTGSIVDTASLAPLDADEVERLVEIEAEIKACRAAAARPIREAWQREYEHRLIAKGATPAHAAKVAGVAVEHRVLAEEALVEMDTGGCVTVGEILAHPAGFHEGTCSDPIEPEYGGGRNKAIIYTDGHNPRIFSHAHGGISYRLVRNAEYWFEEINGEPGTQPSFQETTPQASPVGQVEPTSSDWPEPLDLFAEADPVELSVVPAGCLPSVIERWATTEARRKGTSLAFASAAAIGVAAAAIGASVKIYPRMHDTGWSEPASLWICLVAEPGRAKSPIIAAATQPLRRLDAEHYHADKIVHGLWSEARAEKKRKPTLPDPGPEPVIRRYVVDDTTLEKQVRIHSQNPRGLLRTPDELVGFFASFGAYKAKGDGDRTQALRFFDGGEIVVDRVGDGSTRAESALMGLVAGTQPAMVGRLARDLGADGMLQRFLFVLDDGAPRRGLDEAPDYDALRDYDHTVRALASGSSASASTVRLSSEARDIVAAAEISIAKLREITGASTAWKGHVEKWGKFLPRLILVFHCLEHAHATSEPISAERVSAETATRAISYARFLLRHSLAFYERFFDPDAAATEGRAVAGYLLTRSDLEIVNHRTIYDARKELRGDDKMRLRMRLMGELEAAGWVRVEKTGGEGPTAWRINPRVRERFAARAEWERNSREARRAAILEAGASRKWLSDGQIVQNDEQEHL